MEPLLPTDPREIGRYRLACRIGTGGMGRVYLGITPEGRRAAVKVIRDDLADDRAFRARFRREVAAAASVGGIFTARVLDADPGGDPPWLATQYVEGPSLRATVASGGPLPIDQLIPLAQGLCDALGSIHAAGLIHRDLKPANVLLSPTGARVIDFGIARHGSSGRLTATGEMIGTPDFMAPEQIAGSGIGPGVDIFALGATLVYAATGHGPFAADHSAATLFRIVQSEPDLSNVPAPIVHVVADCLAKDPAARPTVAQIAAQLRTMTPDQRACATSPGLSKPDDRRRAFPLAPPHIANAETLDPVALGDLVDDRRAAAVPSPRRRRVLTALAVAGVLTIGGATAIGVTLLARGTSTEPVITTSAPSPSAGAPPVDPADPKLRYVDRLCASGALLVTLSTSPAPAARTGDPAVAKREFLSSADRLTATIDVALADLVPLRDEAPTGQIKAIFTQILGEFGRARTAFVEARATVAASEPLTVEAYRAGVDRFTDGARNLALITPLRQQIALPPEYTALTPAAPHCAENPPPSN